MNKAIVITFCILGLLGIFPGTSSAVEVSSFGPNQYVRNSGAPDVYNDTFTTTPGQGMLIVKNGAVDGENRITDAISSATVLINGQQIFGPNDFNQQVYLLESSVTLAENNSISIELASNPGSYLTIEVTQDIPLPTVAISADPENIQGGEPSALTWNSTNADSCVIEPDIGSVDVNGSISVSPTTTTTYTVTAANLGGTATASVTVTVISSITLYITTPSNGASIFNPDILVQGTVTNVLGNETGVTVNGIVAIVNGDQFWVNHVPLQEGDNTITANATDTDGITLTTSINVNGVNTGGFIRLMSDTEADVSPLETTLRLEGSFSFSEEPTLTYTGPGQVEFLDSTNENEYKVRMTVEGEYYFTAEARDAENNIHTDTVVIQILDKAELDTLLRTKWEGMRQALLQNDIEGAVIQFDESTQNAYRQIFTLLSPDKLIQKTQELTDIQFIKMVENAAEYDIRIFRDGTEYSFYLLFVKDKNGLWKIRSF